MKTAIMLVTGLLVGLAATEAHAMCQEGATASCWLPNGCPGIKECYTTQWGPCEPRAGTKSCTVCSGSGTQQCNVNGDIITACTRPEQCNNCDDDADGQIDEGLVGCNGVTCGDTFELCGDGLDNDCDGLPDEGCSTCTSGTATSFPFNFNSPAEMRLDTDGTGYGRFMDSDWRLLPSHRMSSFSLRFDQFAMESCCDSFFVSSASYSGFPALPFTTATFNISPGTQTFLGFSSDYSIQKTGVRTTNINVKCNSGGGKMFNTLDLNTGGDGVLLYSRDNAYVTFWLPAGREAFISLDHNFGGAAVDFDMFVTWDAALFGTSCATSDICGYGSDPRGEVVHIPADFLTGRSVKVNISSYSGAGRYRLFVASPVVYFGNDVDLAFDAPVTAGSAADLRGKSDWARAQRTMMSATDGQYRIKEHAYITRDVSCFSCYDLVFSDSDSVDGGCVPAETAYGAWGWYIVLAKSFWNGASTWTDNGQPCAAPNSVDTVANTIVHEWGHYDFDLGDERDSSSPPKNRCGFSLMAGSPLANFSGGNQYFEFCGAGLHGMNPAPGTTGFGGNDNWTDIISDYPQMSRPDGTGDFSRMSYLGDLMEARNFVTFSEN